MSFINYLIMKSKNSGGVRFWAIIFMVLVAVSVKFPPLSVLFIGILFRQYQNYLEYTSHLKGNEYMDHGVSSKLWKTVIPVFCIVLVVGFIIFANWILHNHERGSSIFTGLFGLIFYFFIFSFLSKFKSDTNEMLEDEEEYSYEKKFESSEKIKMLNLKKLSEIKKIPLGMSDSSDFSPTQDNGVQQEFPKNINPKLYIKPKLGKPNVVTFEGNKPITLFDKAYADKVKTEYELRKASDREFIEAFKRSQMPQSASEPDSLYVQQVTGAQVQRSRMELVQQPAIRITPTSQPTMNQMQRRTVAPVKPVSIEHMDSENYSQYRSQLKQYEKKLEKGQKIKSSNSWFGAVRVCPVCGGKSKISRNNKQLCEFCGMEID